MSQMVEEVGGAGDSIIMKETSVVTIVEVVLDPECNQINDDGGGGATNIAAKKRGRFFFPGGKYRRSRPKAAANDKGPEAENKQNLKVPIKTTASEADTDTAIKKKEKPKRKGVPRKRKEFDPNAISVAAAVVPGEDGITVPKNENGEAPPQTGNANKPKKKRQSRQRQGTQEDANGTKIKKAVRVRQSNGQRKKKLGPVFFCRPGVPQLESEQLSQEVQLAIQMSALNINKNVCESFEDMKLHPEILQGILAYGLEKPGCIQQRAIIPCVQGKDAIIQAQSGMGKTAALLISVLQRLDRDNPKCQALILAPTRELAGQIQVVFDELSKFMVSPKVTSCSCVGGRGVRDTNQNIKPALLEGRQVVIGTVGKTSHMLIGDGDGPCLETHSVKLLALDEADQLLDGNFGRDLTTILEKIPPKAQIILMSATMPENILKLAWRFMINPVTLLVRDFQLTLDGIRQYFVKVGEEAHKTATLIDLFPIIEKSRGMIFCNQRSTVLRVMLEMNKAGLDLECITGNMFQKERNDIMAKFRQGEKGYRVIITSDLLGRGIDVQQINLVVNYDLPLQKESYIHRVGRAGRYGRKGIALSLVADNEDTVLQGLKEFYQTEIEAMPQTTEFTKLLGDTEECN